MADISTSSNANAYVQNASGVWTPVGFAAGNASVPGVLRDPVTPANAAAVDARGNVEVKDEPTTLLYETFSAALDTINTWTITGTGPTVAGGLATFPTTVSTTSGINSIPVMPVRSSQYLVPAFAVRLETTAATGLGRFFGLGTAPTTPSATSLAQEGAGFELDSATGVLQAVTYTGGAKTVILALTRPADNAYHRYTMAYRGSRTYWYIDGVQAATATYLNTAIQDLPVSVFQVSGATITGTPQTVVQSLGVGDDSRLHIYLSDATYPWRRAQVSAAGALTVATRSSDLAISVTAAASTALTATLPAPPAGQFHYITSLTILRYAAAALTGSATPSIVTTTNLPGPMSWAFETAAAIGTSHIRLYTFTSPLKSSVAATATTFVAPVFTNAIWRINVHYYTSI